MKAMKPVAAAVSDSHEKLYAVDETLRHQQEKHQQDHGKAHRSTAASTSSATSKIYPVSTSPSRQTSADRVLRPGAYSVDPFTARETYYDNSWDEIVSPDARHSSQYRDLLVSDNLQTSRGAAKDPTVQIGASRWGYPLR
jgi:hypothetical protein